MYTPCLAIIGRPNVGKSTIFNRCTRSRDALVADVPGLTRDRQYGLWETSAGSMIVVDTAGVVAESEGVDSVMRQQSFLAIDEADLLLFVVDGRQGATPDDLEFLDSLRKRTQPVLVLVNKVDGVDQDTALGDFYAFGFPTLALSASHNRGFGQLVEAIVDALPEAKRPTLPVEDIENFEDFADSEVDYALDAASDMTVEAVEEAVDTPDESISILNVDNNEFLAGPTEAEIKAGDEISQALIKAQWQQRMKLDATEDSSSIRVAIVGRPNVGKSTLVNRLIGEQRVAVFDMPGTTRDAIYVPFEKHGQEYLLIDTAGVRRRSKVDQAIEKFSIVKTLQAIGMAHVVICVIDAQEGVVEQDMQMLSYALRSGRSVVLAVNKWDNLDDYSKQQVKTALDRKLSFAPYIGLQMISAKHGTGVGHLFDWTKEAFDGAQCHTSTSQLTQLIHTAVEEHQPPAVRGRRIKLRYAHWGGIFPPTLIIHGNQLKSLPESYLRYLENFLRQKLGIRGTPIKIELRVGVNPYAGKKNKLTDRQQNKRKRLVKHIKKSARK